MCGYIHKKKSKSKHGQKGWVEWGQTILRQKLLGKNKKSMAELLNCTQGFKNIQVVPLPRIFSLAFTPFSPSHQPAHRFHLLTSLCTLFTLCNFSSAFTPFSPSYQPLHPLHFLTSICTLFTLHTSLHILFTLCTFSPAFAPFSPSHQLVSRWKRWEGWWEGEKSAKGVKGAKGVKAGEKVWRVQRGEKAGEKVWRVQTLVRRGAKAIIN